MKYLGYTVLAIFAMIISCTPPVVFDQPYPTNADNLSAIPDEYQGTFICESDSALLFIEDRQIYIRQEHFFLLPLKDVEEFEECRIVGNEMYVAGRSECIPLEFLSDSLVRGIVLEYDTLFSLQETSVARLYEGHVALSAELMDGQWSVSFLSLEPNSDIKYRAITDKTRIKNIEKITVLENITSKDDKEERYKINPTMKQFDELFKDEKVFIECEYLTRVYVNLKGEE